MDDCAYCSGVCCVFTFIIIYTLSVKAHISSGITPEAFFTRDSIVYGAVLTFLPDLVPARVLFLCRPPAHKAFSTVPVSVTLFTKARKFDTNVTIVAVKPLSTLVIVALFAFTWVLCADSAGSTITIFAVEPLSTVRVVFAWFVLA